MQITLRVEAMPAIEPGFRTLLRGFPALSVARPGDFVGVGRNCEMRQEGPAILPGGAVAIWDGVSLRLGRLSEVDDARKVRAAEAFGPAYGESALENLVLDAAAWLRDTTRLGLGPKAGRGISRLTCFGVAVVLEAPCFGILTTDKTEADLVQIVQARFGDFLSQDLSAHDALPALDNASRDIDSASLDLGYESSMQSLAEAGIPS